MFKKVINFIIECIKEEYKFILCLLLCYIILTFPVNYYIIIGGDISNIDSRIKVEKGYKSKGSFNISYVSELKGTVSTYLLSYIIPDWDLEDADNYKYNEKESIDDIEFRNDLDLEISNGYAVKWAYSLANKDYKMTDSKIYVMGTFDEYKTNLKIQDEIISINGHYFDDIDEYRDYVQKIDEDEVEIKIKRKKKEKTIKCKLYEEKGNKLLGVILGNKKEYKTKPKVDINFKSNESGPSGGLITALDIYNKLTKDDLTNSLKIAGTGTIESDGSIGPIGGVKYKLLGAEKQKADVFLVPAGDNYKECLKVKKAKKLKIKVIEVENIKEAISKLKKLK